MGLVTVFLALITCPALAAETPRDSAADATRPANGPGAADHRPPAASGAPAEASAASGPDAMVPDAGIAAAARLP